MTELEIALNLIEKLQKELKQGRVERCRYYFECSKDELINKIATLEKEIEKKDKIIEKEDEDSLIAFKESLFDETVKENIRLKNQVEQLENKLKEKEEKEKAFIDKLKRRIKEHTFKTEKDIEAQICTEILNQIEGEKNGI